MTRVSRRQGSGNQWLLGSGWSQEPPVWAVSTASGAALVPVTNQAGGGDGGTEDCSGNSLLIVFSLI